jgi:hypothetical protein
MSTAAACNATPQCKLSSYVPNMKQYTALHYPVLIVYGNFHKLQQDKVRFRGKSEQLVVRTIVSDTELELADACDADTCALGESQWDKLTYVDQSTVFDDVYDALSQGRNLGIFPEGGSHDRTDLLPLKVSSFAADKDAYAYMRTTCIRLLSR